MIHYSEFTESKGLATVTDLSQVASIELLNKSGGGNFRYKIIFKGGAVDTIETVGLLHAFKKYLKGKRVQSGQLTPTVIKEGESESKATDDNSEAE